MSKPVIFTISAAWDDEAAVWSGHCDDIPAAADAPTLDEVLAKISAMALDLLPDNHPASIRPTCSCKSPRCAKPSPRSLKWRRSSTGRCAISCAPQVARWCGRAKAVTKFGTARSRGEILRCRSAFQVATPPMPSCDRPVFPKRFKRPCKTNT